jgi:hypothetical protein
MYSLLLVRFLSDNPYNSTYYEGPDHENSSWSNNTWHGGSGTENDSSGENAYEFVAFLLWYIFLVLCCIVPTCFAYRRRRLMEHRLAQQQANMTRLHQSNLFILSNLHQSRQVNNEQLVMVRERALGEELKKTTMVVREIDLQHNSEEYHNQDIELDLYHSGTLVLPQEGPNTGSRAVSGVCAICLCPYESGDAVSWSPNETCQHAFHKECLVPWLAKKDQSNCPICRQEFVTVVVEEQPENDLMIRFTPFHFPTNHILTLSAYHSEMINGRADAMAASLAAAQPPPVNPLEEQESTSTTLPVADGSDESSPPISSSSSEQEQQQQQEEATLEEPSEQQVSSTVEMARLDRREESESV